MRITMMIRITSRTINAGLVALALLPVFRQCADARQNGGAQWSWQESQAKVLPTGDLEWTPKTFQFKRGKSVRYIDFEAGDDSNEGLSKEKPWKHHPWDPAATGQAKLCRGVHTYIFKQGILYRGQLEAGESGAPNDPIILTSEPDWGKGPAVICGSEIVKGW